MYPPSYDFFFSIPISVNSYYFLFSISVRLTDQTDIGFSTSATYRILRSDDYTFEIDYRSM